MTSSLTLSYAVSPANNSAAQQLAAKVVAVIASQKLASIDIAIKPIALTNTANDAQQNDLTLTIQENNINDDIYGFTTILKYIARAATINSSSSSLYGNNNPLLACQIDQLLDFAPAHIINGIGLHAACQSLDNYLSARTFFVGHSITIADISVWAYLTGASQWNKFRKEFPHLARWFAFISTSPAITAAAQEHQTIINTLFKKDAKPAAAAGKKAAANGDVFDIDLPGVVHGQVVTRFPPEPSGYLHVGHAKAALLNQEIANRYDGRLLVRFDDTNPSKEKDEYVENIIDDIHRLGLRFEKITYTSDYFPQLKECAERLIKAGKMYADDTPVDKMREERMHGIPSARRDRSVEENLRIWNEMFAGSEEGQNNCMRIKLDMSAANKALRDPVCYRCNPMHHWRTGHEYVCYPTYDFACPFVDALEGVTHALRTSEYKDREAQFYMILKLQQEVWPELPHVHIWDYARLSFVYTVLSKRKLAWFVNNNIVQGWDDPRMPTVQGMLRRGLQVQALREFILSQGASKNITYQEWDKIWTMNKKVIDPVCPRHTAVEDTDKVLVHLIDGPEPMETVEVARHLKYPPAGMKKQLRSKKIWLDQADAQLLQDGEEVTLMAWGNAIIDRVVRSDDGSNKVVSVEARLNLAGDFKKTKLKLTWLSDTSDVVALEMHHFGYLITKKKLEEEDVFEDYVNRDSDTVINAIGDLNMRSMKRGEILQLERKGYYIIDRAFDPEHPELPIVLFDIPSGKSK